jgi:putative ABC transport system ATP-binding protein
VDERASTAVILRLEDVSQTFVNGEVETRVLRGVNLDFRRGELAVVVGASGSGKSTLLNIAGGMLRPTNGRVFFGDVDLAQLDDAALTRFRRENLGFVFQFYNLVPTLTAAENVSVAADLVDDSLSPGDALDRVGLSPRSHHFPAQLSGGEQQRVAIARAIAKKPKVLFCDEPTGALDEDTGKRVLQMLVEINREFGTTVVVITHNAAISRIARRIIRIGSGVIDHIETNDEPASVAEVSW